MAPVQSNFMTGPAASEALGSWRPSTPGQGAQWLAGLTVPWWIAGGWALDLFAGRQGRPHQDLDVGIRRRDVLAVTECLADWQFFEVKDRVLTHLPRGKSPRPEVHSLWCKRAESIQWEWELMLDQSRDDHWVFRREPSIERPLTEALGRCDVGIFYLAPEIQLLYKARATRTVDQADFDRVLALLSSDPRRWLKRSLARIDPTHPWLSAL